MEFVAADAIAQQDSSFLVRPLSESNFGAEIVGANIRTLTDKQLVEINQALLRFKVLVFRDQDDLSAEDQRDFSEKFGELDIHLQKLSHHPQYPDVSFVSNMSDGPKFDISSMTARMFHSDVSW